MPNTSSRRTVCTTCPYCGVGCGVEVNTDQDSTSVSGDNSHPANLGKLCIKGSFLADTLSSNDRLLHPQINGTRVSWSNATDHIAQQFTRITQEHGPDAIGFYLSGQLLTEDYYVANKLMKGFIGSANVDTNSRLCMSSAVSAHKRAFGEDLVPACYEDLECADMILLVGSNMAYTHPVVFQRILAAKAQRPELHIAVLDPRRSATADMADEHLAIAPGSDGFFFNGLLRYLATNGHIDQPFVAQSTKNLEQALQVTEACSLELVADQCDILPATLEKIYQRFAHTEKVVTVFSQGINQSESGTDKGNAIINCHLASGKIGKPGSAPFSMTGQPNAMGGREVGGMANTLAAHMEFTPQNTQLLSQFWNAPKVATQQGLKAVDLFDAAHCGKIKALWIMATNPAVSMPNASKVREALKNCELVIVSDCNVNTDTLQFAHIALPACGWGEKTGTVTNSERRISLQKSFLPATGEAKPDWQIISEVAQKMGFTEAFDYTHPADIFREHAALSGYQNQGQRAFDISEKSQISNQEYMQLPPFQWPKNQARLFSDGHFFTASGRANFAAIHPRLAITDKTDQTLLLNTGRCRDQWHTMTRTGKAAVLFRQTQEPFVHIHPADAAVRGLENSALAIIKNQQEKLSVRAQLTEEQRAGEIFMPIHWNDNFSANACVSRLINSHVDPISGQPQFKQTTVSLQALDPIIEGVVLQSSELETHWQPTCEYWSKATIDAGYKFFIAETKLDNSSQLTSTVMANYPDIEEWHILSNDNITPANQSEQGLGLAGFSAGKLMLVLLTARTQQQLPDTNAIEQWLGKPIAMNQRFSLLTGELERTSDEGPIICNCHKVGLQTIQAALEAGMDSIDDLGKELKCGTQCGSCVPELKKIIQQHDSLYALNNEEI